LAVADAVHVQLNGVELKRCQAVIERCEGVRDATADLFVVQVEGNVQAYMLNVDYAVTGVLGLVAG
jgi:hypothetical protein